MTHHIAIIGSALSGNKGASAMLESSIATLSTRVSDARFTLFSMYPSEDARLNDYANLEIIPATPGKLGVVINSLALLYRIAPFLRPTLRRRSRAIAALASADALLDQGGITFTDGREKFLLYNVASILPALNLHVPVIKCAQAIGPFEGRINRWASQVFLPKVTLIVTRGAITHDFADGLGLTNTVRGADYAFSLELAGDERESLEPLIDLSFVDAPGDVVGFAPSVVMQKKVDGRGGQYVHGLVDAIVATLDAGHRALLVPHSTRAGIEKTHNNDLPLCREIAREVGERAGFLFVDEELSSQQLRYLIGRTTRFVTSRFHAMISSLSMAVPTVVIGWSHKYQEVLDLFGLNDRAFGAAEFSTERVLAELARLERDDAEVRAAIASNLPAVKELSVSQADHIAEIVTRAH
ncbi:MAG: polysaccharide pyruvyl transferase family protein [Actinobacteria bacterium]|nr:polysaccharide pyruvyl transferase family protein [Actinomycetota bacterium]MBU1609345.1 polysaccharide pyruvyl transferase family protein [Actinomycetota bacterium]MBU2314977.1 polysaccharide pyruvyl transferase family protein [Actinomycetota bacterium]MBU2385057.1 polysaccharide pyruvyl transferase family protein [Actinomycetota bacterium]